NKGAGTMIRVSVFGLGYVGSVTAACLAKHGHEVVGVDVNPDKVGMINAAKSPMVEPGLDALLEEVVSRGTLRATTDARAAVSEPDVALIAVGTPSRRNGQPDLSALERVGGAIGAALRHRVRPFTVVLRSTVMPGTTARVLMPAIAAGRGHSQPESLGVA